jgi:hypothetical protein
MGRCCAAYQGDKMRDKEAKAGETTIDEGWIAAVLRVQGELAAVEYEELQAEAENRAKRIAELEDLVHRSQEAFHADNCGRGPCYGLCTAMSASLAATPAPPTTKEGN